MQRYNAFILHQAWTSGQQWNSFLNLYFNPRDLYYWGYKKVIMIIITMLLIITYEYAIACIMTMVLGFSVVQENPTVRWSSRWDYLLESMPHTNIQWFRWDTAFVVRLTFGTGTAMLGLKCVKVFFRVCLAKATQSWPLSMSQDVHFLKQILLCIGWDLITPLFPHKKNETSAYEIVVGMPHNGSYL